MKRFVVEKPPEVYTAYTPSLEEDYENQILRSTDALLPGYHCGRWKELVRDGYGRGAKADMALVSAGLDMWHVVEVELALHPITHVAPQLDTLSQGIYDRTLVPSLSRALPSVPVAVLENLVYTPPGLLCIADGFTEDLRMVCRQYSFDLAIFEPYLGLHGGFGTSVTLSPSILQPAPMVGQFGLRRGRRIGDREVLQLPMHFPFHTGRVVVLDPSGEEHSCTVLSQQGGRFIMLPTMLIPEGRAAHLTMLDPTARRLQLEVDHGGQG